MDKSDWERLIDQLTTGECTPFLGAGACHGTLPLGNQLSMEWAARHEYPFLDTGNLPRVMQYAAARLKDATTLKQQVCRHLADQGRPDFRQPHEVHSFIAKFPIPVYLTTNYDDFLIQALREQGKDPTSAIFPWYTGGRQEEEEFRKAARIRPDADRPLVYHFHGSLRMPASLVLTEDDYLQFLMQMSAPHPRGGMPAMPSAITDALANRPLLFIGYSLQDWTFRVLFHGLARRYPAIHRRRHVSVQLAPPRKGLKPGATRQAKEYLHRYFDKWDISLHWETADRFCAELQRRMAAGVAP